MEQQINLDEIDDIDKLKSLGFDQHTIAEQAQATIQQAQANLTAITTRIAAVESQPPPPAPEEAEGTDPPSGQPEAPSA